MDENDDRSFEELLSAMTSGGPVEQSAQDRKTDQEIAAKLFSLYESFRSAGFQDEHAVFFANSYMTTMIQIAATRQQEED